jgi:AAA domain/Toprim domain
MSALRDFAWRLGGDIISNKEVLCPGPGHSKDDRSLSVRPARDAPDGFILHSFAGDDPHVCMDHVRMKLGLPATPNRGSDGWRGLWDEAHHPHRTLVERYLASRRLQLPIEVAGEALRFHPRCPFGPGRMTPTMIALVRDIRSNEPIGIHRTALDSLGRKHEIDGKDRMALGQIKGGVVKLTPDEDVTLGLGIGEGIETTLSLQRAPEWLSSPVWACLSAGTLAAFPVLAGIESLVVAVDHDEAGRNAARQAIARWHEASRETLALTRKRPGADLNDLCKETLTMERYTVSPEEVVKETGPEFLARAQGRLSKPNGAGHANGRSDEAASAGDFEARVGPQAEPAKPNFRSLKMFCAEFRPISYAVAGLMREGSLFTLTGRTGEGKTAFLVILALAIATGRGDLIGRKVKKGRVAFCTAENPDDLRMRLMIACFLFNIDFDAIDRDVMISDNRVTPEAITEWIKASEIDFTLIIIDTWQAYFDGKDANNPTQAVEFTRRFRPLANLAGAPVVIIAAHPNKSAGDDRLIPNGAGSTLNEVDGNFSMLRDETGLHRLHWLGKIRGVPFEPLHFKIERFDSPDVVTVEGVRVQMPVMSPIADGEVEAREDRLAARDLALLNAMAGDPAGSERTWTSTLKLSRRAGQAMLTRLRKDKLVEIKARKWRLTKAGERMVNEADKADNTQERNGIYGPSHSESERCSI